MIFYTFIFYIHTHTHVIAHTHGHTHGHTHMDIHTLITHITYIYMLFTEHYFIYFYTQLETHIHSAHLDILIFLHTHTVDFFALLCF